MRQQTVSEAVLSSVSPRIRVGRIAQQADADDVVSDVVSVFAVVEQADVVIAFTEVYLLLGTGLKEGPVPARVAMRWPLYVAPRDLVGGYWRKDLDGKAAFSRMCCSCQSMVVSKSSRALS